MLGLISIQGSELSAVVVMGGKAGNWAPGRVPGPTWDSFNIWSENE